MCTRQHEWSLINGGFGPLFGGFMKVRLLQPMNLEGRDYRKDDEVQLQVKDAKALIRNKYAVAVVERAIERPQVEVRTNAD